MHLTANQWALILVFGGAAIGGVAAIAGGMLQAHLQSKNAATQQKAQHEHAIEQQKAQHEHAIAQQSAQHQHAIAQQSGQHEHETTLAFIAARRDAYLEALTWFAVVRDGLRDSILDDRRWDPTDYVTDRRGTAHVDALTEMYGSEAFREATSKWQPAFQALVKAHDYWLPIADLIPLEDRDGNQTYAELKKRLAALTEALLAIQEVARREAGELRLQP